VLLTWVMQHDAEPVSAAPSVETPSTNRGPTPPRATEPRATFSARPSQTSRPSPKASVSATARPPTRTAAPSATKGGLRIAIPSIGLDRRVTGRGLSPDGVIDPPPGTVMWFTGYERVRPGQVGTAVIAGHVTSGGRRDVFADLSDVGVGDAVRIRTPEGKTVNYAVTRVSAVDKQKVTTDQAVWGENTSRSRLAIITCDDAFGFRGDGHRVANLVVIAERR
jgi:sortase (surface protein transpeptidase)